MTTQHLRSSYGNVWSKAGPPGLQTRVNASSLEIAKQCGRKYQYRIVEGRESRREKVDTEFGTLVHHGLELYDRSRLAGQGHDEAVETVVAWALASTWDHVLARPKVFDHPQKNRESLIRVLVWYCDRFPKENDLELLVLADGTAALELTFEFDSGYAYQMTDERITFVGKLDKMVKFNSQTYIKDRKTTKNELNAKYFANYSPNGQVSHYTLAGQIAFGEDVKGLIIEGIQIGTTFARFRRAKIDRPKAVLDEWLRDQGEYLARIERWAEAGYWPQNDAACALYGGCEFRAICAMTPASRETWLRKDWTGGPAE